jgi:hypothetical protein
MARVKYGSIITELRGSIGGTTFQKNKFGHTAKNKGIPTSTGTNIQFTRRNAMLYIVQAWNNLTDAQRNLWNSYAATYPQPIKNNVLVQLSGYALFIKYNAIILSMHFPLFTTPALIPTTFPLLSPSLKWDAGTSRLYFNEGASPFNNHMMIQFFLSPPIKAGQSFNRNKLRFVFQTLQGEGQININIDYTAVFGLLPPVGSRIFSWCRMITDNTPAISTPQSFDLTVEAL